MFCFSQRNDFSVKGVALLLVLLFFLVLTPLASATTIHWLTHPVIFDVTGGGELLKQFYEQTGIEVVPVLYGVDVIQEKAMMEMLSGSSTFDVISLSNTMWRNDLGSDIFLELDSRISEIEDFNDYVPGLVEAFRAIDGKLVALPVRSGAAVLHYREDLFKEHGLAVPTTIDEFVSVAQALTKDTTGDGIVDIYGYAFMGKQGSQLIDDFETWLYSHGGAFFDDSQVVVNNEAGVEAASLLTDLVNTYKVVPSGTLSYTSSEVKTAMQEGLATMTTLWWQYNVDWNNPELSKIAGNARIAKLPQKPGKGLGYGHMGCWAVFIDKNCKEVDAAWEFIKFISSAEAQKYMVARGNGPTRLSSFQSEEFINAVGPEAAQIIADVYAVGKMPSPSPIFPEARETVARELHQAFTGAKTPKQAMDDAASAIQKLIQ